MKQTIYFRDGSIYVTSFGEPPPEVPVPIPEPTVGWRVKVGDGNMPIRVIHDNLDPGMNYESRTLGDDVNLMQTNAIRVPRRYYQDAEGMWRVDRFSKITFWPEHRQNWLSYFKSGITDWQWERFCRSGFGWRDSKANPNDLNPYNFLLCGGTLLNKVGNFKEFTIFQTQNFNKDPSWTVYSQTPHLVFKQGLCGHNADKISYYGIVDKGVMGGVGDLYIPTTGLDDMAAILTSEIREIPKLPFSTKLMPYNYPVVFVEYCFSGSNTYGKTDDGHWYIIEEMLITGDINDPTKGGSEHDWRLYIPIEDWWKVKPIAVIGWQREYV